MVRPQKAVTNKSVSHMILKKSGKPLEKIQEEQNELSV